MRIDDRESNVEKAYTWPPTTAIVGNESQSVGREVCSPKSPRAMHALCSLFTRSIKASICAVDSTDISDVYDRSIDLLEAIATLTTGNGNFYEFLECEFEWVSVIVTALRRIWYLQIWMHTSIKYCNYVQNSV